jgi:hypothetical protein
MCFCVIGVAVVAVLSCECAQVESGTESTSAAHSLLDEIEELMENRLSELPVVQIEELCIQKGAPALTLTAERTVSIVLCVDEMVHAHNVAKGQILDVVARIRRRRETPCLLL